MIFQIDLGHKYLLVQPDVGLFFPAVDYLANKIFEIAEEQEPSQIPIVIDCQRFRGIDYTAVKVHFFVFYTTLNILCIQLIYKISFPFQGLEKLAKDFSHRDKILWFLNLNSKVKKSIRKLGDLSNLKIIDNEEEIVTLLCDFGKKSILRL